MEQLGLEFNDLVKCHLHYIAKHQSGMYGVLLNNDNVPFAVTLQPDDKYFKVGKYLMKKDFYYKGGYETFEVEYPGHDRVLFHIGNHEKDSKLCVLVGEQFELVNGSLGIAYSGHGFKEFWATYGKFDYVQLIVTAREGLI